MKMYSEFKELLVERKGTILLIQFNNVKRKNCLNGKAYKEISLAMRTAANDDAVVMVVFTGVGEFFSAGNDLTQSADISDMEAYFKNSNAIFKDMVKSVMDCPKITMALVNGPAIGIGTTLAVLCDVVWCSDTAYFSTPFSKLGLVPEAASSYLLPLIMGRSKGNEMLLFSGKITAEEAYHFKIVSKVFKFSDLHTKVWNQVKEFSELPPGAMLTTKKLLRQTDKKLLDDVLNEECDELYKRFFTEEFMNAIIQFSMKKNQSKL